MTPTTPVITGERTILDPTGERSEATRELSARPASLDGLTVGLLDISKARGDVFLDRIEAAFGDRGIATKRYRKPTFTKPGSTVLVGVGGVAYMQKVPSGLEE